MTVNSGAKVPNLNADRVDGFHANGLGRLAIASAQTLIGISTDDTQTSLTLTAPSNGFVRLDGTITGYDAFSPSFCTDCAAYVRLKDEGSGAQSIMSYAEGGASTHATSFVIPISWVFPVTPGAHTYSMKTNQVIVSRGGFGFYNPILIAVRAVWRHWFPDIGDQCQQCKPAVGSSRRICGVVRTGRGLSVILPRRLPFSRGLMRVKGNKNGTDSIRRFDTGCWALNACLFRGQPRTPLDLGVERSA